MTMTTNPSVEDSKAFIELLSIPPITHGVLDGLRFAVKDLIDVSGTVTGGGNPSWASTHANASSHAICVEQLLRSGAHCMGKTITDELAFSLIGENHFYGTPLNPSAPNRVPGGSSSGSASAVACGVVDFALGTDTGGSVRVPASNCGIWGFRPTHGRISLAGVIPFAPSFDTVGVFARKAEVLETAVNVLLGESKTPSSDAIEVMFLDDYFSLCDDEVIDGTASLKLLLTDTFSHRSLSLSKLLENMFSYQDIFDTFSLIQCAEIWSSLGTWVESENPEFGPLIEMNFRQSAKHVDRARLMPAILRRQYFKDRLFKKLKGNTVFCLPTTPCYAPTLNSIEVKCRTDSDYFPRTLAMTAIAGLTGAPQLTIPNISADGIPIGLSLIAAPGKDTLLLDMAKHIAAMKD